MWGKMASPTCKLSVIKANPRCFAETSGTLAANDFKKLDKLKPLKKLKAFLLQQWMNTCPMYRHPEREFNGKVWYWQLKH